MAKVGVIVTVYNPCEDYFIECLNSIQSQTLREIEILLVDDGSEKRIADICDEYADRDKRFKVWHKENEGVSIASNFGIEHVNADYFTFVDHDDKIDPQMCEKAYQKAICTSADVVVWNYVSFSTKFNKRAYYVGPSYKEYEKQEIGVLRRMILDPMVDEMQQISLLGANWGKLYKTDLVQENKEVRFPEYVMGGEDAVFTLRALKKVSKVVFFEEYLYYYRQSDSSFTKKFRTKMPQEEFATAKLYEREFEDGYKDDTLGKYYCNLFIMLLVNYTWNPGNKGTITKKKEEIIEWLEKTEIRDAINDSEKYDFNQKKKIFFYLARKNRVYLLLLLSWLYNKMNKEERDS